MDLRNVKKLQRMYGVDKLQKQIESGLIWKFEGSVGRFAMDMLRSGICFLGIKDTYDYYGNTIPSRKKVEPNTTGSRQLAIDFWYRINNGEDIDAEKFLEQNF